MFEEIIALPSINLFAYPVKLMIRIYPDGFIEMFPEGMPPVSSTTVASSNEIADISQQLQDAISNLAMSNKAASQYSSDEFKHILRSMAELGNYAYQNIFTSQDTQTVIENLYPGSSIEIVSEKFILPWQLLYSEDIKQTISFSNFWGAKNIIFNTLIGGNSRRAPLVSPNIITNRIPNIGLVAYKKLPAVAHDEIPYFDDLHKVGNISLLKLRDLNPLARENELKAFCDFWQAAPFHIAHFACHAQSNQKPNLSEITLSDEFSISLQDMVTRRLQIKSNPLVIMNACETNTLNPLYSSHFAGLFLERGARGVVTTECRVPDSFAASFIRRLYEGLFAGKTIGESLLESRQYFWEKFNNPSGLLYTMYGPSAIRLI